MNTLWQRLIIVSLLAACRPSAEPAAVDLTDALGGKADPGFARAMTPRRFQFPQDHGAHPRYRNEWWYVTGNVNDKTGRHYGYQVTLFRIALSPQAAASTSRWATHQLWMAHVALTDVAAQQHWQAQRLARGALGLAGHSTQPFRLWLEDWQITGVIKMAAFPGPLI